MELDFGIFAEISDEIKGAHKTMQRFGHRPKPLHRIVGNSIVQSAGAPSPLIIEIPDTPAVNRMWMIRMVGIYGNDGHTVLTGATADIYAGPEQELITGTPVTDFSAQIVVGVTGNVPSISRWGYRDQPIHAHEHIYALVYAVPAAQQIVLVAQVDDWLQSDREAMSIG